MKTLIMCLLLSLVYAQTPPCSAEIRDKSTNFSSEFSDIDHCEMEAYLNRNYRSVLPKITLESIHPRTYDYFAAANRGISWVIDQSISGKESENPYYYEMIFKAGGNEYHCPFIIFDKSERVSFKSCRSKFRSIMGPASIQLKRLGSVKKN